jgi:hypothetical protein
LGAWGIASSTAEGGAGAADAAQVFYTGSAVAAKAYITLGYMTWESGLATAGTWSAVPTRIQIFTHDVPLPGRSVQVQRSQTAAATTGTTSTPIDDSIPQLSEVDIYMSQAITPTSAANVLRVRALANVSTSSGASRIPHAFFQDATVNALAAGIVSNVAADIGFQEHLEHVMLAGTTSATILKFGSSDGAGTLTFNGNSTARLMGGVMASYLDVEEVMG